MFKKSLLVLAALVVSNVAIAAKDPTPMSLEVFNNTPSAGAISVVGNNGEIINGPILEKNNERNWTFNATDQLYGVTMTLAGGFAVGCTSPDGSFVSLDPENYKGDTIMLVLSGTPDTMNLQCTCNGSACTESLSAKKK